MTRLLFVVALAAVSAASGATVWNENFLEAEGRIFRLGETVYREDFEAEDSAGYWVEGNPDQVRVADGRLILNGNVEGSYTVTAFIDREFSGDLYFSYEAEVLASDTSKGSVNNLNTFIYYSDPEGRDLKYTRRDRDDGAYKHYHELNGYIVTFLNGYLAKMREEPETLLAPNTARIRMRENPGFVLRDEAFEEQSVEGRRYLLQFIYSRGELLFFIDGKFQLGFRVSENRRFNEGYFAFRTFATEMAVDDFEVRKIESVSNK